MTFKEQIQKIKDNWLIAVVLLLLVFSSGGLSLFTGGLSRGFSDSFSSKGIMMENSIASDSMYRGGGIYYGGDQDFAPEVSERKVVKTASLSTEVERNTFDESYDRFKSLVDANDAFLLNDNVNEYGSNSRAYKRGYFSIKVPVDKYDFFVDELKQIGEVKSFNEDAQDITGQYTNVEVDLQAEKDRLARFQKMLDEAERTEDKIQLTDRIFNIEKTIGYYEDRLKNYDQRIDYTTVSFTLNEKQSSYVNIAVVKFSELIRTVVDSFNMLLYLLFFVAPWIIFIIILRVIWKFTRKN